MIYDAHNHLQDERLKPWREDLRTLNVSGAVVNGTQEEDWDEVVALADQFAWVIPSIGLHPWFIEQRSGDWLTRLERMLDSRKCAVGEIGLDRWIENPNVPLQEEIFIRQLEIASRRNLPVTIHCLKAWGRLDEILRSEKLPSCGFLIHSYSGPVEMVKGFAELGGYFSISGYFAQERKTRQQEVFRKVPIDRLLVETDAPDMPLPAERDRYALRGADEKPINHPGNIHEVYGFAAELRRMPPDQFAEQVGENYRRLYAVVCAD